MKVSSSSRKGLSQILYLIIAASVLMMIAMVITFTATDVIGGAGGQATDNTCNEALRGQCAALPGTDNFVEVPNTCVREEQFVGVAASNTVRNGPDTSATTCTTPAGVSGSSCSGAMYIDCGAIT